ncbi:bifunctional RNase H/acid phosphatase [Nocardia puris]|uniref:bifunctional RNase H/acid phosphatase n=1 Tax=Nocardia puris TaxID=208602 RepID=UPI001892E5B6|nr:bifunctional RNase H/acid phosphatase [Nocardia puris]MBF6213093.1 bifunctional RNase H/acid phosphatase [Nocardia puris]MBF6368083.1 bifunctional RNase H/acid phosphatase [Nocardia puris]MBF6462717.1 bifunctional RNase H/acid phosphatase [Nocardia puris]
MSHEQVIVEADGGSRGNPGPAGYGAVVFDADHATVLAERRESIGVATNNVAEYRGLIAGLEAAAELGARIVSVRMDSKLVVEQMSGRWKVKHAAMIPLADRARRLVTGFDRVTFAWIPRAQNSHADRLANEAMDDASLVDEVRTARDAGHAPTDTGTSAGVSREPKTTRFHVDSAERTASGGESGETIDSDAGEGVAPAPGTWDVSRPPNTERVTVSYGDDAAADRDRTAAVNPTSPGWTGALGRPTRFLLLRHGQTELSVQRRYSGRGNPALTPLGQDQADRAAKMLAAKGGIAAVISSPLGRARETAEAAAAALRVPVHTHDGLIETDFGEWEGLTFGEAAERDPELHARWLGDPSVPAPGGESFDAVRERVEAVRRDLTGLYAGSNIVLVSHVTPIKTLLQLALGVGPSLLYRLHLDLASLSIAEFYPDGGSSVRLVNDTSYLD